MSKLEPLWIVTMLSPEPGVLTPPSPVEIRAHICQTQDDGTLLFRDTIGHTQAIIAAGQWLVVEKEESKLNG